VTFRRSILLTIALAGIAAMLGTSVWQLATAPRSDGDGRTSGAVSRQAPTRRAESLTDALAVLRTWDRRRAEVWARGDARVLGHLYVAGSLTGAGDQAMLRAYADRGLVVEGMHTQVLAAQVRSQRRDRVVLVVADRLSAATAVGEGVRLPLPRDRVSRHVVELVMVRGRWRVGEVR
jgi:hypothetical protein